MEFSEWTPEELESRAVEWREIPLHEAYSDIFPAPDTQQLQPNQQQTNTDSNSNQPMQNPTIQTAPSPEGYDFTRIKTAVRHRDGAAFVHGGIEMHEDGTQSWSVRPDGTVVPIRDSAAFSIGAGFVRDGTWFQVRPSSPAQIAQGQGGLRLHNPEFVNPTDIGEGYRLLTVDEIEEDTDDDGDHSLAQAGHTLEFRANGGWDTSGGEPDDTMTYRTNAERWPDGLAITWTEAPSPAIQWHNPNNLTPEEVGPERRLLTVEEFRTIDMGDPQVGYWSIGDEEWHFGSHWVRAEEDNFSLPVSRPIPTPAIFGTHNPESLTPEQLDLGAAWRLYTVEEVAAGHVLPGSQLYCSEEWDGEGLENGDTAMEPSYTYRVPVAALLAAAPAATPPPPPPSEHETLVARLLGPTFVVLAKAHSGADVVKGHIRAKLNKVVPDDATVTWELLAAWIAENQTAELAATAGLHNPSGLTLAQVGEGYRMFTSAEFDSMVRNATRVPGRMEFWSSSNRWEGAGTSYTFGPGDRSYCFRVPVAGLAALTAEARRLGILVEDSDYDHARVTQAARYAPYFLPLDHEDREECGRSEVVEFQFIPGLGAFDVWADGSTHFDSECRTEEQFQEFIDPVGEGDWNETPNPMSPAEIVAWHINQQNAEEAPASVNA